MGIKGLNELGKRHALNAFIHVPIASFAGKRIVIDGHNWMYPNMAIARKKVVNRTDVTLGEPDPFETKREWFLAALNFVVGWMTFNVTPVFAFDGTAPPEKEGTKNKRRDAKIAARAKIDALYQQLKGDILDRPGNIIEELRKELRNYNFIPYEDFELFKMIMKRIGIPCLQAVGDGEHLCSSLCIEGKVAGVFSTDTDNLVYGCPLLITGFSDYATYDDNGDRVPYLDCVRLDYLLNGLNMNHSTFVDLCIMSGCDFNINMPGYAAIKSYKLLQQYRSIDNLPRNLNIECLKHVRCREIFQFRPSDELIIQVPIDLENINEPIEDNPLNLNKRALATARECLDLVGVSGQMERIVNAYHIVTPPVDGHIQELGLVLVPRYVPEAPRIVLNICRQHPAPLPSTVQPTLSNVPQLTLNTPVEVPPQKFLTLKIVPKA